MENTNLSDKSKEALKSGTWKEIGDALKAEIVKEYLRTGYADDNKQFDIKVFDKTYKVLDRGEATAFYDALGNTLFSVENAELVAEYEKMKKGGDTPELVDGQEDTSGVDGEESNCSSEADTAEAAEENPEEVPADEVPKAQEAAEDFKGKAREKLEEELKKANDKQFADPVIGYLLKRCEEDNGLAQDIMQEHKTWSKCFDYIFSQARKQTKGNSVAVRDDVVYEWAEDYYHKDDKAEEEEKARKEAERKERQKKAAAKRAEKAKKKPSKEVTAPEKKADAPKEQLKPKKNNKDMDGQLDMFSMMEL